MPRVEPAALPWSDLPPSFRVDLLQLLSASRPAIRTHVRETARQGLRAWCTASGLDFAADGPWVGLSTEVGRAARILQTDASPAPHEFDLGLLLGYPACCCEQAALVGESQLDRYAQDVASWPLRDGYALLDISRYAEGLALISHLPCSPDCEPSRVLAEQSVAWLNDQPCAPEPYLSWRVALSYLASLASNLLGSGSAPSAEV